MFVVCIYIKHINKIEGKYYTSLIDIKQMNKHGFIILLIFFSLVLLLLLCIDQKFQFNFV